jgi:hypothetical protein
MSQGIPLPTCRAAGFNKARGGGSSQSPSASSPPHWVSGSNTDLVMFEVAGRSAMRGLGITCLLIRSDGTAAFGPP